MFDLKKSVLLVRYIAETNEATGRLKRECPELRTRDESGSLVTLNFAGSGYHSQMVPAAWSDRSTCRTSLLPLAPSLPQKELRYPPRCGTPCAVLPAEDRCVRLSRSELDPGRPAQRGTVNPSKR